MTLLGRAFVDGAFRLVYFGREIRRGKNKGRFEVWIFYPKAKRGTTKINGKDYLKRIVDPKDIKKIKGD